MSKISSKKLSRFAIQQSLKKAGVSICQWLDVNPVAIERLVQSGQGHKDVLDNRLSQGGLCGLEIHSSELTESLLALAEAVRMGSQVAILGIPYALIPNNQSMIEEDVYYAKVSVMAWEWDYHNVFRSAVQIAMTTHALESDQYQLQVDTGMLPERLLALLAGVGPYGRNQFIMHGKWGTAFYLGIAIFSPGVVESLSLSHRQPLKSTVELAGICEACNLCQAACPGKALTGISDFNASLCISALTQKKGDLTSAEMKLMGRQLYGCDICQLVCPANKIASQPRQAVGIGQNAVRQTLPVVNVFEFLTLSNKDFKVQYGQTGFSWRGLKTMKRNALVALGNGGRHKALDFLMTYKNQSDLDPSLAEVLEWAINQIELRVKHDKFESTISKQSQTD